MHVSLSTADRDAAGMGRTASVRRLVKMKESNTETRPLGRRLVFFWTLALGMTVVSPSSSGALLSSCSLTPGTSCLPPDDMGDTPGTLLASRIVPFSFTTSAGITHGAMKAEVFK